MLLVLAQERGGRLWRLADVCAACAAATPRAAVVPDSAHVARRPAGPSSDSGGPVRHFDGPQERVLVRNALTSMNACLPEDVGAAARLLALQCALRADSLGRLVLPVGLVRGMRLGSALSAWYELEDAHWLMRLAALVNGAVQVQLLDHVGSLPSRQRRARAADWALRVVHLAGREGYDHNRALMALALAAYASPQVARSAVGRGILSHACRLTPVELIRMVERVRRGEISGL
ncbi:hypothetical protein ACIQ7Q_24540 [Streptomyces sp. NPDC096176]|uniref:hypothetical protein n=1 Tax=Streptomyces sp. NPDC096176 TaxID=3366079 RepID=UPI0037FC3C66